MANPTRATPLDVEVIDFVAKTEKTALDVGRQMAKVAEEFVPMELPALHGVVSGAFDLAEGVLKAQRDFAQRVFHAVAGSTT